MSDDPKEPLTKMPDWLKGIRIVGDTLVIPGDTFHVRRVVIEDAALRVPSNSPCVMFEVQRKQFLSLPTSVGPDYFASKGGR